LRIGAQEMIFGQPPGLEIDGVRTFKPKSWDTVGECSSEEGLDAVSGLPQKVVTVLRSLQD